MTKHQKVKICQDFYEKETEKYKQEQHVYIVFFVLYVILFVLLLVQHSISSGDKNISLIMIGLSFMGICGCIIEIVLNHKHHIFIRDRLNDHDFVIAEHDGKIQLTIPGTDVVLYDE